jgi:hypothetical protein
MDVRQTRRQLAAQSTFPFFASFVLHDEMDERTVCASWRAVVAMEAGVKSAGPILRFASDHSGRGDGSTPYERVPPLGLAGIKQRPQVAMKAGRRRARRGCLETLVLGVCSQALATRQDDGARGFL